MLKADGFDEAVIGIGSRCGQKDIIAYDRDECIAILCRRDGMSYEAAVEYFEVNTAGAWVGKTTPIFIKRYGSMEDLEDALEI